MKPLRIVLVSLAVFAAVAILRPNAPSASRPASPAAVQADVKACIESAITGKLDETLALIHPRLVVVCGGPAEFRKTMESYREQLANASLVEASSSRALNTNS